MFLRMKGGGIHDNYIYLLGKKSSEGLRLRKGGKKVLTCL